MTGGGDNVDKRKEREERKEREDLVWSKVLSDMPQRPKWNWQGVSSSSEEEAGSVGVVWHIGHIPDEDIAWNVQTMIKAMSRGETFDDYSSTTGAGPRWLQDMKIANLRDYAEKLQEYRGILFRDIDREAWGTIDVSSTRNLRKSIVSASPAISLSDDYILWKEAEKMYRLGEVSVLDMDEKVTLRVPFRRNDAGPAAAAAGPAAGPAAAPAAPASEHSQYNAELLEADPLFDVHEDQGCKGAVTHYGRQPAPDGVHQRLRQDTNLMWSPLKIFSECEICIVDNSVHNCRRCGFAICEKCRRDRTLTTWISSNKDAIHSDTNGKVKIVCKCCHAALERSSGLNDALRVSTEW